MGHTIAHHQKRSRNAQKASSHRVPWSCMVLGWLGRVGAWIRVISKLRKVTLKKAKKAHVSEANAELMDVDMRHEYRLIMPFRCLRWVYHLRGLGGVM